MTNFTGALPQIQNKSSLIFSLSLPIQNNIIYNTKHCPSQWLFFVNYLTCKLNKNYCINFGQIMRSGPLIWRIPLFFNCYERNGLDDVTQYDILPYRTTLHDVHRCFICSPRIQLITTLLTYRPRRIDLSYVRDCVEATKTDCSHVRPSAIKREYRIVEWAGNEQLFPSHATPDGTGEAAKNQKNMQRTWKVHLLLLDVLSRTDGAFYLMAIMVW